MYGIPGGTLRGEEKLRGATSEGRSARGKLRGANCEGERRGRKVRGEGREVQ